MLGSSLEYLKALREGRYLTFLGWLHYIEKVYISDDHKLDADELTDLIFFEWLRSGFFKEDVKHMALFCALYETEPKLLNGIQSYMLVTICSAMYQCMIYSLSERENLKQSFLLSIKTSNYIEALNWIKNKTKSIQLEKYDEAIKTQQSLFLKYTSEAVINAAPLKDFRTQLDKYVIELGNVSSKTDLFLSNRIILAKKLSAYVYEVNLLNERSLSTIEQYINTIKTMYPQKWEDDFLDKISPPSSIDSGIQFIRDLGFFVYTKLFDEESIDPNNFNLESKK